MQNQATKQDYELSIDVADRKGWGFRPRLLSTLRGYRRQDFVRDLVAGTTVGIVALPLAIAFAIASGVRPEAGLVTAVVAGFLISALGGSRVQVGGPTGAFVVIIYSILAKYGLANLILCTMMAGVILIVMGLTGMGTLIKYIPYPVVSGFTSGIAVLIFATQLREFLGIPLEKIPTEFVERIWTLAKNADMTHLPTLALGAASLGIVAFWPKRLGRYVPGSMVALVVGTSAAALFPLGVATIGSKFGGIPTAWPSLHVPRLHWESLQHLVQPAVTIALLAAIESLLSAVVADGMIDDRHDSNQELVAQGIANIASPLFGGIPATGAIARTATNVRNGARTPVAGMVHALVLLAVMLFAAPLAKHVPLTTLAAILMVVAYHMGEWDELLALRKLPVSDAAVLVIVFVLTVVMDLTVAVELGMVLAAILFIKRVSDNTVVTRVEPHTEEESMLHSLAGKEIPRGVLVFHVFGAFLFGAAEKLEEAIRESAGDTKVLVLRLRKIIALDATGLNALERLHDHLQAHGKTLILSGVRDQPLYTLERSGFLDRLGRENVCKNIEIALVRAEQVLAEKAHRPVAGKSSTPVPPGKAPASQT